MEYLLNNVFPYKIKVSAVKRKRTFHSIVECFFKGLTIGFALPLTGVVIFLDTGFFFEAINDAFVF